VGEEGYKDANDVNKTTPRKGGEGGKEEREGGPAIATYPPGDLVHALVHDELLRLGGQVLPQQVLREVRVGRHLQGGREGGREDDELLMTFFHVFAGLVMHQDERKDDSFAQP
jgi:hypothetical protein